MKQFSLILIFCLATIFSCQRAEVLSRSFIDDALEGVLITNDKDIWDGGIIPPKYSFICDLIFYSDGTCRQCYRKINGDNIIHLYHILYWSVDSANKSITLTDPEILKNMPEYAVGVLKIEKYKKSHYTLVGNLPMPNIQAYNEHEINGIIGDSELRAEYESKYIDEKECIEELEQ